MTLLINLAVYLYQHTVKFIIVLYSNTVFGHFHAGNMFSSETSRITPDLYGDYMREPQNAMTNDPKKVWPTRLIQYMIHPEIG